MATKVKKSNADLIKEGLDGRPQRWLAGKIGMRDTQMSNKMTGIIPFTDAELTKIEAVLIVKLHKNA